MDNEKKCLYLFIIQIELCDSLAIYIYYCIFTHLELLLSFNIFWRNVIISFHHFAIAWFRDLLETPIFVPKFLSKTTLMKALWNFFVWSITLNDIVLSICLLATGMQRISPYFDWWRVTPEALNFAVTFCSFKENLSVSFIGTLSAMQWSGIFSVHLFIVKATGRKEKAKLGPEVRNSSALVLWWLAGLVREVFYIYPDASFVL